MVKTRFAVRLLSLAIAGAPGVSCAGDTSGTPSDVRSIDDQVMHTQDSNLPIVMATPEGTFTHALVYDETIHDPITYWAGCLDLVMACYRKAKGTVGDAGDGGPSVDREAVASCVRGIKTCPGRSGGESCCPQKCVDDFVADRTKGDGGVDESIERTLLFGEDCLEGLAEARQQGDAGPEVSP